MQYNMSNNFNMLWHVDLYTHSQESHVKSQEWTAINL